MKEISDWYTRVFLPSGKVVHLLPGSRSISAGYPALCGTEPPVFYGWHGTGTQAEREKALTRPLCKNCLKEIA